VSAREFDPSEFGASFQRFLELVEQSTEGRDTPFESLLAEHFGTDPSEFPVIAESLGATDLPNLQLALTAYE